MTVVVGPADPASSEVRAVLDRHLAFAREVTPPEGVFAVGVDGLLGPEVTFVAARLAGSVVGVGAVRDRDGDVVELKSMHTVAEARGTGVAAAILDHLLGVARSLGARRVVLETGTMAEFEPARALYRRFGFERCDPFGEYAGSTTSYCMALELDDAPD